MLSQVNTPTAARHRPAAVRPDRASADAAIDPLQQAVRAGRQQTQTRPPASCPSSSPWAPSPASARPSPACSGYARDEFFHNGDYEAITPMIRIITWLDPHQTDVYRDRRLAHGLQLHRRSQRSDRRYIPLSLALMREGIANNRQCAGYVLRPWLHALLPQDRRLSRWRLTGSRRARTWSTDVKQRRRRPSQRRGPAAGGERRRQSVIDLGHSLAHALEAEGRHSRSHGAVAVRASPQHQSNICTEASARTTAKQSSLTVAQKQLYGDAGCASNGGRGTPKSPWTCTSPAQLVRVAPKESSCVKGTMNVIGASQNVQCWKPARRSGRPRTAAASKSACRTRATRCPIIHVLLAVVAQPGPEHDHHAGRRFRAGNGEFQRKIDMSQDPTMYSFTAPEVHGHALVQPVQPERLPAQRAGPHRLARRGHDRRPLSGHQRHRSRRHVRAHPGPAT